MASHDCSLTLKYIDKHTTYSFSFDGVNAWYEWTVGSPRVIEHITSIDEVEISQECIDLDAGMHFKLEKVVRFVKRCKEEQAQQRTG